MLGKVISRISSLSARRVLRYSTDSCGKGTARKGLILGAYEDCGTGEVKLSETASKFDTENGNKIFELLKGINLPVGSVRVFHNINAEFWAVAVAGAGPESTSYNESEVLDECKENTRVASGVGAQALQDMNVEKVEVDPFTNPEASAEGCTLGIWRYQEPRNPARRKIEPTLSLYPFAESDPWTTGIRKAGAQNTARFLENVPANLMTPSILAEAAINLLCPCGVNVEVRDKEWIMEKNMSAFLEMAKGSCEPPLLLEMSYCGGGEGDKPVILTGKGSTFDAGGICLKRCEGMSTARADMAGAAVVIAVLKALATLSIPINVNALVPVIENMPGNMATRPGDVVMALNGRTIKVEDTNNEGRVLLADALTYSENFRPCLAVNLGTFTEAVRDALGSSATPVFSTSEIVWQELNKAGAETGDRVWRFPAWKHFTKNVLGYPGTDVHNVGVGSGGDPCNGAAFLLEFAPLVDFVHMDITGTGMKSSGNPPYLRKGFMTGRPTRTVVQFLNQMACPLDKPYPC